MFRRTRILGDTIGLHLWDVQFLHTIISIVIYVTAHGRAPAVAMELKEFILINLYLLIRDGDLASIGTAEVVHAAHRGEKISLYL